MLHKTFCVYLINCNITNKKYIGATSNLPSRMAVHVSTAKLQKCMCSSSVVLAQNNYSVVILEANLNKDEVKQREAFFISAFKQTAVNKNIPILTDLTTYRREYYLKNHKLNP